MKLTYREIQELAKKIKGFGVTVTRKNMHKPKVHELEDFIDSIDEETNGVIWKQQPFNEYKSMVFHHYHETTKKEMDNKLKYNIISLLSQLERYHSYNL